MAGDAGQGKKPQKVFLGIRVSIVTESEAVAEILRKAFENRGGDVVTFANGSDALDDALNFKTHVMIVSDDVKYHNATWVAKEVRYKKLVDIDVLWHVGKKGVKFMDGWINKPFRPIELLKPIHSRLKLLQKKTEKPAPNSKEKVLVIEDEEHLREVSEVLLKKDGYQVVTAAHGEEGIRALADHKDIACILVDLKMPKMNGFEFISEVRGKELAGGCPIIVVSAHTNEATIKQGAKLQVHGWLSKPYNSLKLLEAVENAITIENASQAS